MTQPNHHRIQRQVFELAIGPEVSAPALQASLAHGFWARMLPALGEVFDSVAGADRLLRLDRLEIDLGHIAGADWEPQLQRRLVSELARSLGEQAEEQAHERAPAPEGAADSFRQFLFFLEHGRLPWWGSRPVDSWRELLPRDSAAREWPPLRTTLLAEPRARVRCADVAGDESLDAAFTAWSGLAGSAQVLALLTPAGVPGETARHWRRRFWLMLIDWALEDSADRATGAVLMRALLDIRRAHVQSMAAANRAMPSSTAPQGEPTESAVERLPPPWREWHAQAVKGAGSPQSAQEIGALTTGAPRPWLAVDHSARRNAQSPAHENAGDPAIAAPRPPIAVNPQAKHKPQFTADEDAIYLAAAGTVLLHPFLEALFRDRGLLAGREFCDATARHRAVLLLGYLGFGCTDVPEHDLLLAKLLCGHELEEPLDPLVLDADDIAACDALLAAVLGHWTALRSSSAQWLRAQFFLREGKLECVDEGHRLTVERHAQDVLLARIPWGFGVIALPWMPGRLFVRWLD